MNFSELNEIILAILLGLIQGATEFLPISSTAHMRLVSAVLLDGRDFGQATSNVIQFGTLIAVLQYFWEDIKSLFFRILEIIFKPREAKKFFKTSYFWLNNKNEYLLDIHNKNEDLLLIQLLVGTLPIIFFGFLLRGVVDDFFRENLIWIALFLAAGAALLAYADFFHQRRIEQKLILAGTHPNSVEISKEILKNQEYFNIWDVLLVGLFQSLAIFPGMSRSGSTLAGSLLMAKERAKSVRFSFLLSIPAIGLSSLFDFSQILLGKEGQTNLLPNQSSWQGVEVSISLVSLLIAVIISFISGLLFLKWLLKYLSKHKSNAFIWYRILLALTLLGIIMIRM